MEILPDDNEAEDWITCTPAHGIAGNQYTVTGLQTDKPYRLRVRCLNAAGLGNAVDLAQSIFAKDIQIAPEIEVDAEVGQFVTVRAGAPIRLSCTIRGRPLPSVKWQKEKGTINDMAQIENTSSSSSLLINHCSREDAGRYLMIVENSSGSKTVTISVKVLDTPGPVKELKVMEVTREHVLLSWEPPVQDGGSVITNYAIGKRETTRKSYQIAGSTQHRTSFKVTGLTEGDIYFFRVAAENEYGLGAPCETKQPVKISEAPSTPERLDVDEITDNSVALAWSKPEHDGGSQVTNYVVEFMQPGAFEAWTVAGTPKTNKYKVSKLTTDKEYIFRVRAQNDVGTSDARESNLVTVREIVISPTVDASKYFNNTVAGKAGACIDIQLPYTGRPVPAAHFLRHGEPLKETSRINSNTSGGLAKLTISDLTRKDAGDYDLVVKNSAGSKQVTMKILVMEKPSPPSGPLQVRDVMAESVTLEWSPPTEDGGTPVTHYTLEKLDSSLGWVEISSFVVRTSQKVTRLVTGQEYVFRVRAANKFGLSEPLDSEPVTAQHPFNPPGPPGVPVPVNVSNDAIVIAWQEPTNDGGSPIIGYHVEKKDRNSIMWTKANSYSVRETTFKCGNLTSGLSYEFRVTAENLAGLGKPSKASEAAVARDPIEPPRNVHATKVNRTSIRLEWKKPEYDGGSRITGYIVEKMDVPGKRWAKCNFNKVTDLTFTADGLSDGSTYEFRVLALNAAGSMSKPSVSTGPITVRDNVEPASVDVDAQYKDVVAVRAGEKLNIHAYITGRPTPSVIWQKDGKDFEPSMRMNIVSTEVSSDLTVKDVTRLDTGVYTIVVRNAAGERSISINVRVLDTPGPCQSFKVTGVAASTCQLSWQPPTVDGGSRVTSYTVEKRETSRLAWTTVTSSTDMTHHKVVGLILGNEYIFRIRAENKYGLGESLETLPVLAVDPFVAPDEPRNVQIANVVKDSLTVTWEKPESDGGAEIMGYILERREKVSPRWLRVNRRLVSDTRFRVTELKEGSEHEFRVYAENRAGVGSASSPSGFVLLCDPIYPPEPPGIPQVVDSSSTSVTLKWSRPMYDGGSEIIGYSVEYANVTNKDEYEESELEWITATDKSKLKSTLHTTVGLKQSNLYLFRVCAHNKSGSSLAAITPAAVAPVERHEAPTFGPEVDLRKTVTVRAGGTVRLFVPISGRPSPSVVWSRKNNGLKDRAVIDNTDSSTTFILDNVSRSDSGKYTLTLANESGSISAFVMVKVLDSPSAPDELVVTGKSKNVISVSWKPPENDGGSPVNNYILERREATKKAWSTVETACTRTSYKFTKLNEGFLYFFRVMAENEYGVGPPAQTETPVKASEEPGPPRSLQCTEVTKDSVTLVWTKPDYDGGSEVVEYSIEQQLKGFDQWTKVKSVKSSVHSMTVKPLTENQLYTFRVAARSDSGSSLPTELSGYVLVATQTALPDADLGGFSQKVVEGKAGTTIQCQVVVKGKPFPELQWKRDGEEVKMTSRVNYDVVAGISTLTIKDAELEDAGLYHLVMENSVGGKIVPIHVRVLDKPGPPKGPVVFSNVTADSLAISWNPPEANGGAAINNYVVDMREVSGEATEWRMISGSTARTILKVTRLKDGMDYAFRIRAENRFGLGKALESQTVTAQFPFSVPAAPGAPRILATSRETITIRWEAPASDGGSPVLGYHVEKKERNSILWTKCSKTLLPNTEYKVTNLQEGLEYEFRVCAENLAGVGKYSRPSESAMARDPVDPPRDLDVVGVTRSAVHLQWKKPDYDGGARITGYIIERCEVPHGRWLKCNFSNVSATDFNVEGLTEGAKYDFRVYAKNAAGAFSSPATTTSSILVKDESLPPIIDMDCQYKDAVVVRAGKNFKLEAGVRGKPTPGMVWKKDGIEMNSSSRVLLQNTGISSSLHVLDATRSDSGIYSLTVENNSGSRSLSIQVKVLDKPAAPSGPLQVTGVTAERCTLTWNPPEQDGGAPITNYVVEKRETSHLAWIQVNPCVQGTSCKVGKLLPHNEYIFRVRAENKYGVGDPLQSNEMTAKNPFTVPSAPVGLDVSCITRKTVTLLWSRPTNDGGSEISGYTVEKKQHSGTRWIKVNRQPVIDLRYKVCDLNENQEYEFRVCAENAAGMGAWSDLTLPVLTEDPKYPPDAPISFRVDDTSKSSASLSWLPPTFDGGSEIMGYVVEMSSAKRRRSMSQSSSSTVATTHMLTTIDAVEEQSLMEDEEHVDVKREWLNISGKNLLRDTYYCVTGLRDNMGYLFRVAAVSKAGTGTWAILRQPVICVERKETPDLIIDETVQRNVTVKAGFPLRLNLAFRGRPPPQVTWSKADTNAEVLKQRALINTTEYTTSLLVNETDRDDSGKYMVIVENCEGSKDFTYTVKVVDTPGPVSNLTVTDVTCDSVTLKWSAPENDGSAVITNYVIQKREASRKAWMTVSSDCTRHSYKVTQLNEGDSYMFRVFAENANGLGKANETKEAVKVSMTPSPPTKFQVTGVTKSSVTLAWNKPDHSGGSEVTDFLLEMVLSGFDNWQQCKTINAFSTTVKGLEEGREYLFRVSAANEKGLSEPCTLTSPVTVKDVVTEPAIDLRDLPVGGIHGKAGSDLSFSIPISGKPVPDITWKKDDELLKQTSRVFTSNTAVDTCIAIKSCKLEDSGQYQITASNVCGTKHGNLSITVLDKPGKISDLNIDTVAESSVSLSWQPPREDGGCQISNYVVQMRETEVDNWTECSATAVRPRIKVPKLLLGKEYQFRVAAENRFGCGDFVLSEKVVVKFPFNKPGPPGIPVVNAVGSDYVLLRWHEPVHDGGSSIIAYHVEMKDRNSILWRKVNRTDIRDTAFKITGLQPGLTYEFRTYAENAAGCGKPSQASDPVIARDQISPPTDVEVAGVLRTSVDLTWRKPDNDGGARITGYIVERREPPTGRWLKCNFSNVVECAYSVSGLMEDTTYEFRVIAKNAAGSVSAPSVPSAPVTCKDSFNPPRIDLAKELRDTVVVKAGEIVTLSADVYGKPLPSVTWSHDSVELEHTPKTDISTSNSVTTLKIKDADRDDSGEYSLHLQNSAGSRSISICVKVLDRPGQPGGPLAVTEVTSEKCRLTWRPPENCGGAPVKHYVIEKRETSRLSWTLAADNVEGVTVKVARLLNGNEYLFRVMAVNKYGVGIPLESLPVLAKDPFSCPSAPGRPQISTVLRNSVVLTWQRPTSDGGNEITGYHVERKERNSVRWTRAVRRAVTGLHHKITGLKEGSEYEFRVAAENSAGLGPFSDESYPVICREPVYPPGPVGMPKLVDTTQRSVTLAWAPPSFDGGSKVSGYQVEVCPKYAEIEEWSKCTLQGGVKSTEFTVSDLQPNKEYKFRVAAINASGCGEMTQMPVAVITTDRLEAPVISADCDLRKNITIKAGNSLRLYVPLKGRPAPTVRWNKESERSVGERTQIDTNEAGTTLYIPECHRDDSGKYTLTLENSTGSASGSCFVKVLDTPGPCQNLSVKDVGKDHATITWNPPVNDGGCVVTNYIVEKKEMGRKAWSTITTGCQRTHLKITLSEGLSYLFRVIAENENGIGEPAETVSPVKATEVPGSPDSLEVVDVTKSSVSLRWSKPDEDGGSKILGYHIESLEKDQNKWIKRASVSDCFAVISSLREGQEYAFRVVAVNETGASDPRECASLVMVRDSFVPPSLDMSQIPRGVAHVKAGANLDIRVPYAGKPLPSIKWFKNSARLKPSSHCDLESEDTGVARLKIHSVSQEDAGEFELVAENQAGKRSGLIKVVVLDKPGPVEDLQTGNFTESSVVLLWQPPLSDGGSAISCYVVDLRSDEEPDWKMISSAIVRNTFKCSKLQTGKEYTFRVRAMNRFGLGPAVLTKPVLIELPYKAPGAPGPCHVSQASKEAMVVNWQEPVKNGGSEVIGYHLEMKERNSILWKRVNRAIIRNTHFRVTGLQEGLEYEFRVLAENAAGIGKPSQHSESVCARDPVDVPRDVEVDAVTRSTCLVRWKKPDYDGGQRIVGYVVEKREHPEGRWVKACFSVIPDNQFLVTGLTGGSEYEFRVIAKNSAGMLSSPSASTGPVKCEDNFQPPYITLDPHLLDQVKVAAGSTIRLHAAISGKPDPAVTWFMNSKEIKTGAQRTIDTTFEHSTLLIKDCSRADSGNYTVIAQNACGERSAQLKVLVLDKPGPPSGPFGFSRITESHVTCSWDPPLEDGGSKILHYILSKRETSRLNWSLVTESEQLTSHTVPRLIKGNEYQFRVQAVNEFGVGEPLDSEPIVAANSFTVPSRPGMPEVSNVNSSGCTVTWKRPDSDGGAEIDGYVVERRERKSSRWIRCGKQLIRDLRSKVSNITEGNEYEFRVAAENAAGLGPFSLLSLPCVIRNPIQVPTPPGSPKVRDTTRTSVSLAWSRPAHDGGSPVIGYLVEYATVDKNREAEAEAKIDTDEQVQWKTVQSNVLQTSFTVGKLDHETSYLFRVSALNKGGISEPAQVTGSVKPVEKMETPDYDLDATLRKTVIVKAGKTINVSIPIKGRPAPNIQWKKDGVDVAANPRIHVDNVDGKTIMVIQDCCRDDTGKYNLSLENASGVASTFVSIRVLDIPGPPAALFVKQVTQESVTISWEPPLLDGGSEVFSYHVERRDATLRSWTNVSRECNKLFYKIEGLNKGKTYLFRVMAQNEWGVGVPLESSPVTTTEIPSPVNNLRICDVLDRSISLVWDKPDSDGGSQITSYHVEYLLANSDNWTTLKTRKTAVTVEKLQTGEQYEFRVAAENEAGLSEWLSLGPITARMQKIPPDADLSSIPDKVINLREGSSTRLDIPLFGKPMPLVKWSKDLIPLKQSEHVVFERNNDIAVIMLKNVRKHVAGQYVLHLESSGGRKDISFNVNVYGNPGKIKGLIEFPEISAENIVLKWNPPEDNGGSEITNYIIEKKDTSSNVWSSVNANCTRTTVRASKLHPGTEYVFRVAAENKYGMGEFVESMEIVAKYPFRPPSAPPQPEVIETTADTMTVTWKECHSDGGSEIVGYNIEKKEHNAILWTKLNALPVRNREYKVTGLTEGLEYQFRVYAENLAGLSPPSESSKPERARNVVSPPSCPDWTDITRDSVTLIWKPPKHDGGSKIIGYNVEKRSGEDGRWFKCNYTNVQECEFTATALNPGEKYQFRVYARNASGTVSKPSIPSAEIVCRDDFQAPSIQLDPDLYDGVSIRAGEKLRLKAVVTGKPHPRIIWAHNGQDLVANSQVEISNIKNTSTVSVKDTSRLNGGTYTISARNPCATKAMDIQVTVLDKPGPPEGPVKFTSLSKEKVTLWWNPPKDTGGAIVDCYIVEKRETTRLNWAMVSPSCSSTNCTVTRLINHHEYQFRISAQNKYGIGEALLSEPVVAKISYTVPDPPGQPQCCSSSADSITISYARPKSDGGNEIIGYTVERREKKSMRWLTVNKKPVNDLRYKVSGLTEGNSYEFRVYAENAAGLGKPSETSSLIVCREPVSPPGPPSIVRVSDTTRSTVALVWAPPTFDGGSPVTGYVVEAKKVVPDQDGSEWMRINPELIRACEYIVPNLEPGAEYNLRVKATNIGGAGEPAALSGKIMATDKLEAPNVEIGADFKSHYVVRAGTALRIFILYHGRPIPSVTWSKPDTELQDRAEIHTTAYSTLLLINATTREDSGKYTVCFENNSGEKKLAITVKVLDSPGPVGPILCKEVTCNSVTLSWDPPLIDGGSLVKNYLIEKREVSRRSWQTVATKCSRTSFKVDKLQESASYLFRVLPENEYGIGLPRETENPITVTEAPSIPERVDIETVSF